MWWFAHASTLISPVVQVRTYDALQGKYVQQLWNWSASIISKEGLLLTNNHVAQNTDEEDALWYLICVTTTQGRAPECIYTANVIARDSDLDIALLQLNSEDINWNKVDFATLPVLEIDFSYVPKDSDKVQAVWYPGIWWDTLTTTNGSIAGTLEYNDATYIKTDTTIAPWNSGWPMLSTAWKQIWLNTFWISTQWESLWYALLMSEAKKFIDTYQDEMPAKAMFSVDLGAYANMLDNINKQQILSYSWITYKVPTWYEIQNIVDGVSFLQRPKQQKEIQVSNFLASIQKTPELETEKKFLYYLEQIWYYNKRYIKLIPTTIGGKKFFKMVYSFDETGGEGWGTHVYLWQLQKDSIVLLYLEVDWASEKKLEEAKKELELVLKNITFNDKWSIPAFDGKIIDPKITFLKPQDWAGSTVVQDPDWWDSILDVSKYFGNLNDQINIMLNKTTKATNIKKIFETEYKDTAKNMKSLGKLQWYDAFIVCQDNASSSMFDSAKVDENNKPLQQFTCQIGTIITSVYGIPYRVDIMIKWPRARKEAFLQSALTTITKEIVLWKGETTLPNLFKKSANVWFKDLRDQTVAYRQKLETLVWYGLLKKWDTFAPYTPITYGLLAEKYLQMVHNINITMPWCTTSVCHLEQKTVKVNGQTTSLATLLNDVEVQWTWYVDENKAAMFMFYIQLKLAGGQLASYSEVELDEAMNADPDNPDYAALYEKINSYNATLYWWKKIDYEEFLWDDYNAYYTSFFRAKKVNTYIPWEWIILTSELSNDKVAFKGSFIMKVECKHTMGTYTCVDSNADVKKWAYRVLDKATMIDMLVSEMDFGLFDKEMAKKKTGDVGSDDFVDADE